MYASRSTNGNGNQKKQQNGGASQKGRRGGPQKGPKEGADGGDAPTHTPPSVTASAGKKDYNRDSPAKNEKHGGGHHSSHRSSNDTHSQSSKNRQNESHQDSASRAGKQRTPASGGGGVQQCAEKEKTPESKQTGRGGGGGGRGRRDRIDDGRHHRNNSHKGSRKQSLQGSEEPERRDDSSTDESEYSAESPPEWVGGARAQMQPAVNHNKQPWLNLQVPHFSREGLTVINLRNELEELHFLDPPEPPFPTEAGEKPNKSKQAKAHDGKRSVDGDAREKQSSSPPPATVSPTNSLKKERKEAPMKETEVRESQPLESLIHRVKEAEKKKTFDDPPPAADPMTVVASSSAVPPDTAILEAKAKEDEAKKKLSASAAPWKPTPASTVDLRQLASQLHMSGPSTQPQQQRQGVDLAQLAGGLNSGTGFPVHFGTTTGTGGYSLAQQIASGLPSATLGGKVPGATINGFSGAASESPSKKIGVEDPSPKEGSAAGSVRSTQISPLPSLYSNDTWSVDATGWGDVTQILKGQQEAAKEAALIASPVKPTVELPTKFTPSTPPAVEVLPSPSRSGSRPSTPPQALGSFLVTTQSPSHSQPGSTQQSPHQTLQYAYVGTSSQVQLAGQWNPTQQSRPQVVYAATTPGTTWGQQPGQMVYVQASQGTWGAQNQPVYYATTTTGGAGTQSTAAWLPYGTQ